MSLLTLFWLIHQNESWVQKTLESFELCSFQEYAAKSMALGDWSGVLEMLALARIPQTARPSLFNV